MRAVLAVAAAALLALVVAWPGAASPGREAFPLSPYPMFARDRGRTSSLATVVAVEADGTVRRLSPELVNGTREVVQAAAVVAGEVAGGRADRLCREVAARVAALDDGRGGRSARTVEVVTETYDAVDWFAGRREPARRLVHAACPLPRP